MAAAVASSSPITFVSQSEWADARGPPNVDKQSPVLATKGDADPQWLKDLQRDGVSDARHDQEGEAHALVRRGQGSHQQGEGCAVCRCRRRLA